MTPEASLADLLYPSSAKRPEGDQRPTPLETAAQPDPASAAGADVLVADRLYGNPPDTTSSNDGAKLTGPVPPSPSGDPVADRRSLGVELPAGAVADAALVGEFAPLARAAKLSPEHASKLVRLHQDALDAEAAAGEAIVAGWQAETSRIDSGERAAAEALMETYGDKALREAFNLTGVGQHPAVIRWAARVQTALRSAGR